MEIRGSVCLVTGASSGIGRATAIALAREGATVAVAARRQDKLAETLAAVRSHSAASIAVPCDVSIRERVEEAIADATRRLGGIDILVNNAGVGRYRPFVEETPSTILEQVNVNLLGAIWCARAVLPQMIQRRRGHLVHVASINARIAAPMQTVYDATKFGLSGFAEALAAEVAPFGVRTTIVYPGPIDTEFFDPPEFARMRTPKKIPAEAVARAITRAVRRNRFEVTVPGILRIPSVLMKGLAPGLVRRGAASYAKATLPKPPP
jgi:short-subunit dehydrogenase